MGEGATRGTPDRASTTGAPCSAAVQKRICEPHALPGFLGGLRRETCIFSRQASRRSSFGAADIVHALQSVD